MARVTIPVFNTRRDNTVPVPTAGQTSGAGGNRVHNDGHIVLVCTNTNAVSTARTLTVTLKRTVDGVTPAARTFSVPAPTKTCFIGPFPPEDYGTELDFSVDNAELTILPLRII